MMCMLEIRLRVAQRTPPSVNIGVQPKLTTDEIPYEVSVVLVTFLIGDDAATNRVDLIQPPLTQCPLGEQVTDHLTQVRANPGAQRSAKRRLRPLDHESRDPPTGDLADNHFLPKPS